MAPAFSPGLPGVWGEGEWALDMGSLTVLVYLFCLCSVSPGLAQAGPATEAQGI